MPKWDIKHRNTMNLKCNVKKRFFLIKLLVELPLKFQVLFIPLYFYFYHLFTTFHHLFFILFLLFGNESNSLVSQQYNESKMQCENSYFILSNRWWSNYEIPGIFLSHSSFFFSSVYLYFYH